MQNAKTQVGEGLVGGEEINPVKKLDKRELRQQAASRRKRLSPLRHKVSQLEQQLHNLSSKLVNLENKLAESDLYEETNKAELTSLLQQRGQLNSQISTLEEQWLINSEELDSLLNPDSSL